MAELSTNLKTQLDSKVAADGDQSQDDSSQTQAASISIKLSDTKNLTLSYDRTTDSKGKTLVAYTTDYGKDRVLDLNIGTVVTENFPDLAALLPQGLLNRTVSFGNALLVYDKPTSGTAKWLFGLDLNISAKVNFDQLPLIQSLNISALGKRGDGKLLQGLRLLVASKPLTRADTKRYNGKFPNLTNFEKLPEPKNVEDTAVALRKGFSLTGGLAFLNSVHPLSLPVGPGASGGDNQEAPTGDGASAADKTVWFKIQKQLGPVSLERIGFQYSEADSIGALTTLFDASFKVSKFALSLDGLQLKVPFDRTKQLEPGLIGVGVDFQSKNLEIGGALRRVEKERTEADGQVVQYEEYQGAVKLKLKLKSGKNLGISAVGAYARYKGATSLFFFAVLDYPLGGPPIFFVNGLALGFGYNRALTAPSIDQVQKFPLVQQATGGLEWDGENKGEFITTQLGKLDAYINPAIGSYFLAIGIKFMSFKMVNSFVLLTVAWGEKLEINVLGISSLVLPTPVEGEGDITPIAEVTLTLRIRIAPDDGILSAEALLAPTSFILSRACKLTGGFAFYAWTGGEHKGDFVITLGGYHPRFKKPAHYPTVPRLGFNWEVGGGLFLKGEAYCALCSHAVMAGGRLEARYEGGWFRAWFVAGADFLVMWKPLHYDIQLYVSIGAQAGFISFEVGADVNVWGPDFGGIARVTLGAISVTIDFGDQSSRFAAAIGWQKFEESFLPEAREDRSNLLITAGAARMVKNPQATAQSPSQDRELAVVNPKHFTLTASTVMPNTTNSVGIADDAYNEDIGVSPMAMKPEDFESTCNITIQRDGDDANDEFSFKPILEQVPAALWGTPQVVTSSGVERLSPPGANDSQFVQDALMGFEITPANLPTAGTTDDISIQKLLHDTEFVTDAYSWRQLSALAAQSDATTRLSSLRTNASQIDSQSGLLGAFGFDPATDVTVTGSVADDFFAAPQIENGSSAG